MSHASQPSRPTPADPSRALGRALSGRRAFGQTLASLFAAAVAAAVPGCHRKPARSPLRPADEGADAGLIPLGGPERHRQVLDTEEGAVWIDDLDPQVGPRDARCVVVVFSDFECPFCKDMADVLARVRRENPKDVRFVYKHLPLPMHPRGRQAAIAAQVVYLEAGTDAFWRFHDRAFAHQTDLENQTLSEWALQEGVRAEQITLRGPDAERRVDEDVALALKLGIRGTPHLFVNDHALGGAWPYDKVRDLVDGEL